MRSQNINYNSAGTAGRISCFLLLLLAFLIINPISTSVYAEGEPENTNDSDAAGEPVVTNEEGDAAGEDYGIDPQAAVTSTVNIAFTPTSANASMTPVDSTGAKAKVDVKATVTVQNSGGYDVYVGSSSSQLKAGSNTIDSVTAATTYANLPVNRWGYSFAEGTTVKDSYEAMPATLRGTAKWSNKSASIANETKTFMLSFAANIGADKPAGTYTNQVTMSVVSSPLEITNKFGIETMQQMTSTVCNSVAAGTSDQLKDTRDGKYYWVSKLADGKCWMTQNLDLDLKKSTKLTTADSDVPAAGYTPAYDTATTASSSTILANDTGQRSWSLGNVRITNPTVPSDCGPGQNSAANCPSQFTAYSTPTSQNGDELAHYILGNHYQWNTATAGTGGSITSGTATNSICPKGWRLPTSNTGGELETLINKLGDTSSTDSVTKAPFYGVRGGIVYQTTTNLFSYAGERGYYWSSTPRSSDRAYHFRFYGTTTVNPTYYDVGDRKLGYSVRCIAR